MRKAAAAGLASLYVVLCGVAAVGADSPTDIDAYFLPSVQIALAGHPFFIYSVRQLTTTATYANANGPLSMIPLTAFAAVANRFGWLAQLRWEHVMAAVVFSVFLLWLGREALRAIDRSRAVPLEGRWRIAAYAIIIASPVIWLSQIGYGHFEQPIAVALTLLAVRALAADRPVLAGLALGLVGLTRTLTLVFAIPLTILLWRRRGPVAAVGMVATAALTAGIGLLPFVVADPGDVFFSMARQHAELPVGIGSVWYLLEGTPIVWIGAHLDTLCIAIAVAVTTVALLRARPDLGFDSPDVFGLLAIAGIWVMLLIKIEWPYYLMEPFVFATIWWLARVRDVATVRVLLPAFLTAVALIAEFATRRENTLIGGVATSTLVATLLAFIIYAYRHISRRAEPHLKPRGWESEPELVGATD